MFSNLYMMCYSKRILSLVNFYPCVCSFKVNSACFQVLLHVLIQSRSTYRLSPILNGRFLFVQRHLNQFLWFLLPAFTANLAVTYVAVQIPGNTNVRFVWFLAKSSHSGITIIMLFVVAVHSWIEIGQCSAYGLLSESQIDNSGSTD